jgi:hypothetical protein
MEKYGAYVGNEWVSVKSARWLAEPDQDGPGVYCGGTWVALTCARCGNAPSRCPHKKRELDGERW